MLQENQETMMCCKGMQIATGLHRCNCEQVPVLLFAAAVAAASDSRVWSTNQQGVWRQHNGIDHRIWSWPVCLVC